MEQRSGCAQSHGAIAIGVSICRHVDADKFCCSSVVDRAACLRSLVTKQGMIWVACCIIKPLILQTECRTTTKLCGWGSCQSQARNGSVHKSVYGCSADPGKQRGSQGQGGLLPEGAARLDLVQKQNQCCFATGTLQALSVHSACGHLIAYMLRLTHYFFLSPSGI